MRNEGRAHLHEGVCLVRVAEPDKAVKDERAVSNPEEETLISPLLIACEEKWNAPGVPVVPLRIHIGQVSRQTWPKGYVRACSRFSDHRCLARQQEIDWQQSPRSQVRGRLTLWQTERRCGNDGARLLEGEHLEDERLPVDRLPPATLVLRFRNP